MIWFILGREYKLSISEILTVFPKGKTVYFAKDILILESIETSEVINKASNLWWTIKIIEISDIDIVDIALESEWKFKYWINIYWWKKNLREIILKTKKELKKNNISSRFVNKDFQNLSSAQLIWEKLVKSWTDYSYIYTSKAEYIWKTIWVQDINAYSKRDYSKDRDMQTGMLPPKLSQMMINISGWNNIYDPFVWLGTVLIEALLIWSKNIYWSDLNDKMVELSEKNINTFISENNLSIQDSKFFKLNAKFIDEAEILKENKVESIVTEWYLWEVMTQKNISIDRIEKQKESLKSIYEKFFLNLKKINYSWNIVICFPFWEINWKHNYFDEIYNIVNENCIIQKLFPKELELTTKVWSLLYKRDKQLVWREIFKLKIK